jgi:hypothetical protein
MYNSIKIWEAAINLNQDLLSIVRDRHPCGKHSVRGAAYNLHSDQTESGRPNVIVKQKNEQIQVMIIHIKYIDWEDVTFKALLCLKKREFNLFRSLLIISNKIFNFFAS